LHFAKICPRITLIDANQKKTALPKRSELRLLLNHCFLGSALAFIRVIRGLNVFGCGFAAPCSRYSASAQQHPPPLASA